MKLSKMALVAVIACGTYAGNVFADQTNDIQLVACADCDCGQPVCGCEAQACDTGCCDNACDSGCCDSGCDSCGRDKGCGLGGLSLDCLNCGDCCLGDPYTLFGDHGAWSAGGWLQMGYTSNELPAFNTYDDHFQLQQAWLYAEKAIDTSCGFDIGGRIDYLYGTDAQNTQAFGTGQRGWDNSWDNGVYGNALPQLYLEAGYGDMSVMAGKFYTIVGYEVVQATGNFFYSHAYTFNYSEPFTHTGVLAKYDINRNVNVWGGWTAGIDSGFDDNGDAFLGGISAALTDDLRLTYATTAGRFAEPWSGVTAPINQAITGYQHSIVAEYDVTNCLKYVIQNDVLSTDFANGTNARDTVGINQYLIKTINDCWAYGARFEWWNIKEGPAPSSSDIFALTLGVNYRPHANVIVRPEIRWDWDDDQIQIAGANVLQDGDDSQTTFGIDTILTF